MTNAEATRREAGRFELFAFRAAGLPEDLDVPFAEARRIGFFGEVFIRSNCEAVGIIRTLPTSASFVLFKEAMLFTGML